MRDDSSAELGTSEGVESTSMMSVRKRPYGASAGARELSEQC